MPKVYLSDADRHRAKMTAAIYGQMRMLHVTTSDLGECWDVTQQAAAYRVRQGTVSIMDLYRAQNLLQFTDAEVAALVLGNNREHEEGGLSDQRHTRPKPHKH